MPAGYGGLIRQHSSKLAILQRVVDGTCIASNLWLAVGLHNVGWNVQYSLASTRCAPTRSAGSAGRQRICTDYLAGSCNT
jgi:hypothetical protein